MDFFIVLITTFIATALSSMSGGGTSIISLPVFLWLGLPLPVVLSIEKINASFWTIPASFNYLKGRKVDWLFLMLFSSIGLIGSYFGFLLVISINQRFFEIVIGILIVFLVIFMYFQKDFGLKKVKRKTDRRLEFITYPFALILGFYESILGAGNAIFFSMITFLLKGFDFIDALGHYYAVAFVWVTFAAVLFIQKGYFNFYLTIPAIIGSVAGGYIGSKYAKYKGNKFIKLIFMTIGGILGVKLIIGI